MDSTRRDYSELLVEISMPELTGDATSGLVNIKVTGFTIPSAAFTASGITTWNFLNGGIGNYRVNISGISHVTMTDTITVPALNINISGESQLDGTMDGFNGISGAVSGISTLRYRGTPVSINVSVGGLSNIIALGQ